MATELVTQVWCDYHLAELDEKVSAAPAPLVPEALDLCEECAAPFHELAAYTLKYGRNASVAMGRPRASGEWHCPECGKDYSSKGHLRSHLRSIHDKGWVDAFPDDPANANAVTCDVCGNRYADARGLSVHKRLTHSAPEEPAPPRRRGRPKSTA